ncbi:MAG: GNAT family N-acetyltransferase [Candidatus Norongarragalinales archaeon]
MLPRDKPSKLREFVAKLVREGAYLLTEKIPSLAEERKLFFEKLKQARKGNITAIVAESNGAVTATAEARRNKLAKRDKVELATAVSKPFNNTRLGKAMPSELIKRAKKELKPANIYLAVFALNKPAKKLY